MLPPVMEKLLSGKDFRQYAGMVNLTARKGMTGTQDTAEHHAIVITGVQPGELDREERLVYTLIVGRMLETFMPPCKVEYTTVETVCAAHQVPNPYIPYRKQDGSVSSRGTPCFRKLCPLPRST